MFGITVSEAGIIITWPGNAVAVPAPGAHVDPEFAHQAINIGYSLVRAIFGVA